MIKKNKDIKRTANICWRNLLARIWIEAKKLVQRCTTYLHILLYGHSYNTTVINAMLEYERLHLKLIVITCYRDTIAVQVWNTPARSYLIIYMAVENFNNVGQTKSKEKDGNAICMMCI